MGTVLLVLQLIVAIFLVAVILLQRSNGGALSGLGGGTSVNGLLSARGKGNILTRITAVLATLFFVLSLALSIYYSRAEVHVASIVDTQPIETSEEVPASENSAPASESNAPAESENSTPVEVPTAE